MKTPLLRGRSFEASDTKEPPPVLIIDQLLADRFFPGEDAVGKRIRMSTGEEGAHEFRTHRRRCAAPESLRVRGNDGVASGLSADGATAADRLGGVAADFALAKVARETGARHRRLARSRATGVRIQDDAGTRRGNMGHAAVDEFPLVCFAVLALTLAVVGLYGVMAFNGLRRMREIGVRLALGAMPAQIRTMMLQSGHALARYRARGRFRRRRSRFRASFAVCFSA